MGIQILDLQFSNKQVEWEEKNYFFSFQILNQTKIDLHIKDIEIHFYHEKIDATSHFQIEIPQKSLSQIDEQKKISVIFGVLKHAPIGTYDISVRVRASQNSDSKEIEADTKIEKGFRVEPCGRKIKAQLLEKARVGNSFGLQLEVLLDQELDTSYEGKHTILCSTKDFPYNKKPETPRRIHLEFVKGKAKTEKVFTFFEPQVHLEFYETEVGGVSGLTALKIKKESIWRKWRNSYQQLCSWLRSRRGFVAICLFLLILTVSFYFNYLSLQQNSYAKVIAVHRNVFVQDVTSKRKSLQKNDIVFVNDKIIVEEGSFCVLELYDKSTVKLYSSSSVESSKQNSLSLTNGSISFQTQNIINLDIKTPHIESIEDITSKNFQLRVKNRESAISVFDGKLSVTAQGVKAKVTENTGLIVEKGKAPGELQQLPQPPTLLTPRNKETVTALKVPFSWQNNSASSYYSLEVFRENAPFAERAEQLDNNELNIKISKGKYHWLVSTINESGFASKPSQKFLFTNHPQKTNTRAIRIIAHVNEKQLQDYKIIVNGQEFDPQKGILLGQNRIVIEKEGYLSQTIDVDVTEQEDRLTLKTELTPKPVNINWVTKTSTMTIIHNGKKVKELPKELPPGTHVFSFKKEGFLPLEKTIKIDPSNQKFKIEIPLKLKKRTISIQVKPNSGKDSLNAKITLNGKKLPSEVLPGSYMLRIESPGFYPIIKKIEILPKSKPIFLQEKMKRMTSKIFFVVKNAPKNLTILGKNAKSQSTFFPNKIYDIILGKWEFQIIHKGYKPLSKKVYIRLHKKGWRVYFSMQKIQVELIPKITFSHQPQMVRMTLQNIDSGKISQYTKGNKIPSGRYRITIEADSYKPYTTDLKIDQKLILPIQLQKNIRIIDEMAQNKTTGKKDRIIAIEKNGQKQFFPLELEAGKSHLLTFLLNSGAEITERIYIPTGEGKFVAELSPLLYNKLVTLHFVDGLALRRIRKNEEISLFKRKSDFLIDNLEYDLIAYENEKNIDRKRIQLYPLLDVYRIGFAKLDIKLRIEIGFYYGTITVDAAKKYKFIFNGINIPKLEQHLQKIDVEKRKQRIQNILQWDKKALGSWTYSK